jgi:hypothetical protein
MASVNTSGMDLIAASDLKGSWTGFWALVTGQTTAGPIVKVLSYTAMVLAAIMLIRYLVSKWGKGGGPPVKLGWGFALVMILVVPEAIGWVLGVLDKIIDVFAAWGAANLGP